MGIGQGARVCKLGLRFWLKRVALFCRTTSVEHDSLGNIFIKRQDDEHRGTNFQKPLFHRKCSGEAD